MPRFLYFPLRMLALLGAIAALIAGAFALLFGFHVVGIVGDVPGLEDTVKRTFLYASLITSGVEFLLISGLGSCQIISRRAVLLGMGVFGTVFLISAATLLLRYMPATQTLQHQPITGCNLASQSVLSLEIPALPVNWHSW